MSEKPISPLRRRMIEDMTVRNFVEKTHNDYIRHVRTIDLPGLPQIPAPATDQSCAATSSANTLIGVGCPHAPPSCTNLHSAPRSRRHRLPFPAGSFIEGFRTPATVQAASLRSAGIRNPQQKRLRSAQHPLPTQAGKIGAWGCGIVTPL